MRIGLVTIGQSPRDDINEEIIPILKGAEIIECGALDDLSIEEIECMKPERYTLVTRLRDGSEVKVDRDKIVERVKECISRLDVDIIGLLCTGEFPHLNCNSILVEPSALLLSAVNTLLPHGKLGFFVPSEEQIELSGKKWGREEAIIKAFSPYSGREKDLVELSKEMKDTDLVVMDCFGYTSKMKEIVKKETKKPVLLARTFFAFAIKALI